MRDRLLRYRFPLLIGLLLLAFALRMFRLDHQSLWWDEGISLHLATSALIELLQDRLNNIHPPLYFIILKGWLGLVGVHSFTGRYLSALASLGQVAVVFAAMRVWLDRAPGRRVLPQWSATVLIVFSSLSIIYGQEIRVYAMLPLVYLLMLLLAEGILSGRAWNATALLCLAVVEWAGLHLHYISLFAVAYVALWGTIAFTRRREVTGLRRWLVTQAVVGLASLPWLAAVAANLAAVQAEANAGTFTAEPVPLAFLLSQVWVFQLTGLAGALSSQFVRVAASLVGLLLVATLLAVMFGRVRQDPRRLVAARLAAHWAVPLLSATVVWSIRSFSHPRYIIMFAVMLIPLAGYLVFSARGLVTRAAGYLLLIGLFMLSIWGIGRYFFFPGAAKPDMRGVAGYLESITGPDDLIIVPDTDWSLPFEYQGPAGIVMPNLHEPLQDEGSTLNQTLDCTTDAPCARSGRVFVVDYALGTRDWQERLPFELQRRGYLAGVQRFDDLAVLDYRLFKQGGPLPSCDDTLLKRAATRFGPLDLDAAIVQQGAASDTAVAIALCWHALEPAAAELIASLVLRDPLTGERIGQVDDVLVDPFGAPTTAWTGGEAIMSFHVLDLPVGTPPVDLELLLGLYSLEGDTVNAAQVIDAGGNPAGEIHSLGDVSLSPSIGLPVSREDEQGPPLWDRPVQATDGLELLGARLSPGPYRPGQTIRVGLTWRAVAEGLPSLRPKLILESNDMMPAENDEFPVNGRYPTDRWQAGEIVFENRDIRVPADAAGSGRLHVEVNGNRIPLGEVLIDATGLQFERPPVSTALEATFEHGISLVGVDMPETISPAAAPRITLTWHLPSDEIQTAYTVFVHLVSQDGRIVAQSDSPPANGTRPTSAWLAGEYIVDPHELLWREADFRGPVTVSVGLYDPHSGKRLLLADGSDHFSLPVMPEVLPPTE